MITNTKVIITKTLDPWWNLAVEEFLLGGVEENQCILYLWQNQNTVVIGRNQNPWRECRKELLESEGGKLARRLSGGGAVFHDTGNLNFTFLMKKEDYDLERQVRVILNAVRNVGIQAEMSGRNDLTADGRKFSGNAFCFKKSGAYHHGTILVNADMGKLSRYLQVSKEKIASKGVASVESRVVNLIELQPELTIEKMVDALVPAFNEIYGTASSISDGADLEREEVRELYKKYASWEWRYGEAPRFDIELSTRFLWGGVDLGLTLENSRIKSAAVFSDAMDEEFIRDLPQHLNGQLFSSEAMAEAVLKIDMGPERLAMQKDIAQWLREKGF